MTGIVAIVNGRSPERMGRYLGHLLHTGSHGNQPPFDSVVRPRVALAVPDRATVRPRLTAREGAILAVCGRLFEPEVATCLGEPDPDGLLMRFMARGAAGLQGLNGDYLVAVWEDTPGRLTVVNDRFGLRRLYYWISGHRLVLAPTLSRLAALPEFPRTLDEVALADYLSFGHHLDGRTWYAAARLLPPASVLAFADGQLSLRTYWRFEPTPGRHYRGLGEWEGDYLDALGRAVRRRLLVLDDSADIWLEDSSDSSPLEALLAKSLSRVSRVPVATRLLSGLGVPIHDGFRPCHAGRLASLAAGLEGAGATLFTDHLGAVFGAPLRPPAGPEGTMCSRVFGDAELRQILRTDVYRMVEGAATDALARSYAEAPGESPAAKAIAVFLRQHQHHRSPFPLEQIADDCRVRAPFTDPDVVEVARTPVDDGPAPDAGPSRAVSGQVAGCACGSLPGPDLALEGIGHLLEADNPLAGEFFRIPQLRELIRGHLKGQELLREKLCVLGGIGLWLGGLRHHEPRPGDPTPRTAKHLGISLEV